MASKEELSPEEKLLKVIQDGDEAATMVPAELSTRLPRRRRRRG